MKRSRVAWPVLLSLGLVGFQAPAPSATAARPAVVSAPKPQLALAFEGMVKGPDGKPVEGALVIARKVGNRDEPFSTRTSSDGRFRLPLPRKAVGPWDLRVEAKGLAAAQIDKTQPGTPLSISLQKGRGVTGTVRDGADNRPVAGALVEARATDRRFALPWEPAAGVVSTLTDRDGRFRLEGLGIGLFEVSARAPRYGRVQRRNVRPGASVDLLLLPGASILGVVTGPDSRPVVGAVLAAQRRGNWGLEPAGTETTDVRGRFSFVGVEPGAYVLVVHHSNLAPSVVEATVEPLIDAQVDIVLARGAPVLGRLIADRDRPLAGKVSVEELGGRRVTSRLAEILRAEAGPDGLFVLERLPPGSHVLAVQAPGFAKRRIDVEVGVRAASVDLGEIALERGLVIGGHVQSRSGAPIADASVTAYQRTDALVATDSNEPVRTEADGAFVIGGLDAGSFTVSASAPGYGRARTIAEAGSEDVRIELAPGGTISGRVTDGQGQPVEAFRVNVERLERDRQGGGSSFKDAAAADGRFSLEDLAEGTYVVRVNAPDMAPGTASGVGVKAGQTSDAGVIRLSRGGTVRGTVLDTAGAAVAGATVAALPGGRMSWLDRVEGSSDGAGAFELLGVRPGRVTVSASHPAYAEGRISGIDVDPAKGAAEARVVLSIGGRVQGSARKRDGAPILGSRVDVLPRRPEDEVVSSGLTASVQADGTFVVERVPPGPATVSLTVQAGSVYAGGQGKSVTVADGQTTIVDFSSKEVLVSGRVTRNDEPVAGVRVTAYPTRMSMSSPSGPDANPLATGGAGPRPFTGTTADDGSYELIVLEPGDVSVELQSLDGKIQYASRYLTIPDAPGYTLDFKLSGVPVSGIVVDKETGQGVPVATVHASPKKGGDDGGTSTGADGRFAFEVPPGEYTVSMGAEGYARSRSDLSVGPQGVSDVRLELSRGLVLLGKVVDPSGRPAAGQRVTARARDVGSGMDAAMTLGDGTFRFDRLSQRAYDLSSGGASVGFAVQSGVTPGDKDVVLTLRPGGRLRLAVVDGSGAPVAEAQAWVVSVNGVPAIVHAIDPTDAAGLVEFSCPSGILEIEAVRDMLTGKVTVEVSAGSTTAARLVVRQASPNP